MNEENKRSINFEEQLIALKKRQKKSLISKLLVIGVLFAILFVYLFTPLSQVGNYKLSGNLNLTEEDVLEICHLERSSSLFFVDEEECLELLNGHPLIEEAKVSNTILGFKVEIEEITPVLKTYQDTYYFSSGSEKATSFMTNPVIPTHFKQICDNLPIILSSSNISEETIKLYSDIYFSLSKEYQDKIRYFQILDNGDLSFFFYDNFYYEIVLSYQDDINDITDLSYPLDKTSQIRYYNEFFYNENITLNVKNYQNQITTFEYYSILVKIEYKFGSQNPSYSVCENN